MNVLFVCTGNTCRSPMAQALCQALHPDWDVRSAGIAAYDGEPASENAVAAMAEKDLNLSSHKAHQITPEDIACADQIYTVSQRHTLTLRMAFPQCEGKIFTLQPDIPDPYGGDLATYRACARQLEQALGGLPYGN